LIKNSLAVARAHEDLILQQKIGWLIDTLETGEMPDYLAGERRE
jgi:hypothetical protein